MNRIFAPLSLLSVFLLFATFALGWQIDDPKSIDPAVQATVQRHFLLALGSLCFTTLVHAIVLTYFMGTGRWIEETATAYRLGTEFFQQSQRLKYRIIPAMMTAFLLLLLTGGLGASADPASPTQFQELAGLPLSQWHLGCAIVAMGVNAAVHYLEYASLFENSEVIGQVLAEVRRIRIEKGLPV